jgi:hypothetical protein
MNIRKLSLALMLAGAAALPLQAGAQDLNAAAAQSAFATAPDPARQVEEVVRLLRANDVATLVQVLTPPEQYRQLLAAYEQKRSQPVDPREREEFAEAIDKLIAADAVDRLMAEIEPKLREGAAQSEGMILMGLGALNIAANSKKSDLTPEQRTMIKAVLPGLERWIIATDFFSEDAARQALTLLSDGARRTGILSLDQLQALPLEDALARAGTMLDASKQALRLYGIDIDAIVSTAKVEVLAMEGEHARIRTTVTVFDAPISGEQELVLLEGRWYSADAVKNWQTKFDQGHHHKHSSHRSGDDSEQLEVEVEKAAG